MKIIYLILFQIPLISVAQINWDSKIEEISDSTYKIEVLDSDLLHNPGRN